MKILMVLIGLVLLLPGLCAVIYLVTMLPFLWGDPATFGLLSLLWIVCGFITYGGIRLIQRGAGK
ncbi:MAG: hypothetical protein E6G97_13680 [Alphaproteobacteria bacterium]|nr:MAG: hypothetical protein E6G97_13680 [Alphaproteobacteria bacterium]